MSRKSWRRFQYAAFSLCIFVVDTATTTDIVIAMLYVVIVIAAMRSGRTVDVLMLGFSSTALTVVSFLVTIDTGAFLGTQLVNCAMSVLAIACVTWLCLQSMRAQSELRVDRKRMASISRSMSMTEMAAAIAHEVTQPLAAIGANAGAASRWLSAPVPDIEEAKTAATRITKDVLRASTVVERMRTLVSGKPIDPASFDLDDLVGQVIEQHRLEIEEASIDVGVRGARKVEVVADRVLIQQVLTNALNNSIDALSLVRGGMREILFEVEAPPGRVSLTITDTGTGLEGGTEERIFDPFYTTKAGRGGLGIGLAVCRTIIEAHGGTMRASPNEPRGLAIGIDLPSPQAPHSRHEA